jgi:hypothetical protein
MVMSRGLVMELHYANTEELNGLFELIRARDVSMQACI